MNNVIRIIGENVPDMEAVDFSENKLPSLENFTLLEEFAPNLKILDLSNNRLNDIRELEKLKSLNIRVIDLRNNALVSKFKERSDYIEKVRDILGKFWRFFSFFHTSCKQNIVYEKCRRSDLNGFYLTTE